MKNTENNSKAINHSYYLGFKKMFFIIMLLFFYLIINHFSVSINFFLEIRVNRQEVKFILLDLIYSLKD